LPVGYRYIITPQIIPDQGYDYSPPSLTTVALTTDGLIRRDFTATLKKYTISGTVWNGGVELSGAILKIWKNDTYVPGLDITTGATGTYAFTDLDAHSKYHIEITHPLGLQFVTATKTFLNLVGDKPGEDFNTTTTSSGRISGTITREGTGAGVQDIIVQILNTSEGGSTYYDMTSVTGSYEVNVPLGANYRITPLTTPDQGYTFEPSVRNTTEPLSGTLTGQNFTAKLKDYTISGVVYNAFGEPMAGVTVTCTGLSPVTTLANGRYSFTVQALGNYEVRPTFAGTTFSPTFVNFDELIGNRTQDFRALASRGELYTDPENLNFGDVLINKTVPKGLTIGNSGARLINVSRLNITGPDANCFSVSAPDIITLEVNDETTVSVSFTPNSIGGKVALLNIYHDGDGVNPVVIPLTGNGVRTVATIGPFPIIDFGLLPLNSRTQTEAIDIVNNSPYYDDILTVNDAYYIDYSSLFGFTGPQGFPGNPFTVYGGDVVSLYVSFSPVELGVKRNVLRIINTSSNLPEAEIIITANVFGGDLVVNPPSHDYGVVETGYMDKIFDIQNVGSQIYTISDMYISGDVTSFILLNDNEMPITIEPGQTVTVTVRFYPSTVGEKAGVFNIISDYNLAPHLFVPLTGVTGVPDIYTDIQEIDFGTISRGMIKDTVLIVSNVGSTDLVISGANFLGDSRAMFSIASPKFPLTIKAAESDTVIIRATGLLPNEVKNARVGFISNDPDESPYFIDLFAKVSSVVIVTNINDDRIIFDSVIVGYYQDTVLILTNEGDITCEMTRFELSGAYSSDFSIDATAPFTLAPGESKTVNIRFKPLDVGQRYAVINMSLNDPVRPNPRITLQGWGINKTETPELYGGGEDGWDFGQVPIRETRTKDLLIYNPSEYAVMRIDNMEIDPIVKQPFSYGNLEFPLYINPRDTLSVILSFTPDDKVRFYQAFLTIQYSDSLSAPNPDDTLKILLYGAVLFPNMDTDFTRVLKFGLVEQNKTVTQEFTLTNSGSLYLRIDSIQVVGEDAAEFTVNNTDLPAKIEQYEEYIGRVTFTPSMIGSKDARLLIFNTDFFGNNNPINDILEIEIWADGVPNDGSTIDITKLDEIPTVYDLAQNYPNPFNPTTKIEYSLPDASRVRISVYNNLGQEVINLVDDYQSIGKYIVEFNAHNLPSGIYFYRIQSDKFTAVKKMMLLK